MYDVIVIGSGVAGSTAAYFLAEAGAGVLVIEKAQLPRYKTCGGGVVKRAVDLLPFNIDEVVERKLFTADILDQKNILHFNIKRGSPIISMVMRKDFDYFILKKASSKGAVIKDDVEVTDFRSNASCVKVFTSNETFNAKYIIGADGAMGITTKKLLQKNSDLKIPAIENEIYVEDESFKKLSKSARFDFGLVPHGYAWVFPKKNHLSIGVLTMKASGINLNKYLQEYISKLGINKILNEEKHGFIIPLNLKIKNLMLENLLFVGDAAGFADPITAEGISYAIESGKLAAKSIIEGNFNREIVSKIYRRETNKILKELKYARMLAFFVYQSSALRSRVFRMYGEGLSNLLTDISMGEKTYAELLKNPLNYFKLLRKLF